MNDWAIKLFQKSVVKQVKWRYLTRFVGDVSSKVCLDLGSDNGVISYLLRQRGGSWKSADILDEAVDSIRALVQTDVYKINHVAVPFQNQEFDCIIIVDLLEHIHEDEAFVSELNRVLKPGGTLIINVPHRKNYSLIRILRALLGLTDEDHGHVREGYVLPELISFLPSFQLVRHSTYSRPCLELVDMAVSFAVKVLKKGQSSSKGTLVTDADLKKHKKMFTVYALAFPFLWTFVQLDYLLFFLSGYRLIAKFKKGEHE